MTISAASYIKANRDGWKQPEARERNGRTPLRDYVSPVFGSLPVELIDTNLVLKVVEPIWTTKRETAGRIRGRIEAILELCEGTRTAQRRKPGCMV